MNLLDRRHLLPHPTRRPLVDAYAAPGAAGVDDDAVVDGVIRRRSPKPSLQRRRRQTCRYSVNEFFVAVFGDGGGRLVDDLDEDEQQ